MKLVPLTKEHLDRIKPQAGQSVREPVEYLKSKPGYAIVEGDTVLVCFGFSPQEHVFLLWAVVSEHAAKHMVRITKIGKRVLAFMNGEIWAAVEVGFEQGHRWVAALDFKICPPSQQPLSDITFYKRYC